MSYSRPSIQAGRGLKRTPETPNSSAVGVFDYTIESNIATKTSLGIVQIGNNINVDANGVISTYSSTDLISVYLTAISYTAVDTDYYIGATKKGIDITLPIGVIGKVYMVKNQSNGSIQVTGTNGQLLDSSSSKSLGTNASLMLVFDGTHWNII